MIRPATIFDRPSARDRPDDYQQRFESVAKRVDWLARCLSNNAKVTTRFDEIETMLCSLPLSTADYAVATCRLRNARRSAYLGERGVARYELQLLSRSLFVPAD